MVPLRDRGTAVLTTFENHNRQVTGYKLGSGRQSDRTGADDDNRQEAHQKSSFIDADRSINEDPIDAHR
ncbi:hypothetical protein [Nocardia sp. bgisy134]|uniref:hypothetical protein n=1 Tax=Nocardia sp. bgisy134 TaxID=3413789 RepID=UPI003D721308